MDDERCVIRVVNAGAGFDPTALTGAMPEPDSARGRGLAIMHALMDGVELTSEPGSGTTVRLVKTLAFHPTSPVGRLRPPH